jgi:exopolysaccharide/PEP-CTERM locus tyrosine autokinase
MGIISNALERDRLERTAKGEGSSMSSEAVVLSRGQLETMEGGCSLPPHCSQKLVVLSDPESVDAENFKVLRAQILFPSNRERPKTIMITSAFPGEGKTFVAANLAVSIALGIDEHVLLVDCDLRRSNVHEMFGYDNHEGLCEYLTQKRDLAEVLIRTEIRKLSLLAAGRTPPNPTELLSSGRMEAFLEEVRARYADRFVVLDSAPSLVTAESGILAKYVDGIVLVVMAQKPPRRAVQKAVQNLGREKILGIVFNGYSKTQKEYHKYYKRYYKGT